MYYISVYTVFIRFYIDIIIYITCIFSIQLLYFIHVYYVNIQSMFYTVFISFKMFYYIGELQNSSLKGVYSKISLF